MTLHELTMAAEQLEEKFATELARNAAALKRDVADAVAHKMHLGDNYWKPEHQARKKHEVAEALVRALKECV